MNFLVTEEMQILRAYCGLKGPGGYSREQEREALLVELSEKYFPAGLTSYDAVGLWANGGQERTIILEVITDNPSRDYFKLTGLAAEYKEQGQQEAVLLTKQNINASFI